MVTTKVVLTGHDSNSAYFYKFAASTVGQPKLANNNEKSKRIFHTAYNQYAKETKKRVKQLVGSNVYTKVLTTANIMFCVDAIWLESLIDQESIDDVNS